MKKLLFVTTALCALGAGPAHADPVTSWMATTIFGAFSTATATALAQMTLGLGLNLLVGGIAMAAMSQGVSADVQFDVEFGDDTALAFTVGEYVTAGKRKYIGTWGKNTRYVTEVIEVSCLPQGLAGLYIDDEPGEWVTGDWAHSFVPASADHWRVKDLVTFPDDTPRDGMIYVGRSLTAYQDDGIRVCVHWYDGTQTEADQFLRWVFGGSSDYPWTADHIGTGKSYAIVTTRFDESILTSYPSYLWQPEPLPMYDPRLDSTAGGVGSHRWGDRSTYAATTNAAVIAYNLARGIYFGDEWVFGGKNFAAWRLPFDAWVAAANACDAPVSLSGGGEEPAYRAGMQVTVDMEPLGVLEEIGRAANMRFAEVGGMLVPQVDLPAASVLSITDDDIIITEGQSFTPFYPVSETYNALSATYPEPAEKWASKDAPEYVDADATAADGGRYLPTSVTYGAAPYADQVQRLMRSQMRDYRRMRRHQFQLPPMAYGLQPLVDKISWTSARNGYEAKEFIVESVQKLPGMCVAVTLREVDAGDYDWSTDYELPYVTVSPVNPIPAVQEIEDWTAIGTSILGEDGVARLPAILVSCASGEVGIDSVRVQVRRPAAETCVVDVTRPYDAPYSWTVTGVAAATAYEVRGELVSSIAGRSVWSDWITVTTPDVRVSVADLDDEVRGWLADLSAWIDGGVGDLPAELSGLAAAIVAEAEARAQAAQQLSDDLADEAATRAADVAQVADDLSAEAAIRVNEAAEAARQMRATRDRVTALVAEVIDLAAADHAAREEIRRSLSVQVGTMRASYDEQIVVLADADMAAAARIETLEASSADLSAEIQQVAQAQVDGDDALAALITAMSVGTAVQFDQAAIWYYDDGADGWTGGTWITGGYLAPSAALLSPASLAIDGVKYAQLRLRVQRTGTPIWTGTLRWWVGGVEATVAIPEPDWSEDIGLITVAPGWSGTVDQIGLDLPASGVVIDWIAIGRPAPGASSADLSALQQTMIAADTALAQDIIQLQADLTDAQGDTEAVASAVDGLTARVTSAEDTLTSQSEAITALQSGVDDLGTGSAALSDAVDTLTTEVQDGSDAQTAQAGSIRSLRSQVSGVAAELLDALSQSTTEMQAVRAYVATASEQLTTRVVATDEAVEIVAEAVTALETAIPDLASSTALDALTTRVMVTEGDITSQGSAITTLQNDLSDLSDEVDTKAAASALSALQSTVTTQGGTITSQGSQITSISNEVTTARGGAASLDGRLDGIDTTLGTKASASALTALTSTVTSQGGTITSQGSQITSISNEVTTARGGAASLDGRLDRIDTTLGTKASASALTALTSTVTSQGSTITSQGSQITSISNEVTTARGGATSLDGRLDGIDTTLGTKASASALSALTSTVTSQGSEITAQADSLTDLSASVDGISAEGLLRVSVETTPSGALSRIGLVAKASASEGKWRTAALYLEAVTGAKSRVIVQADRFAVTDGSASTVPFIVSDGQVYIASAMIGDATITRAQIGDHQIYASYYFTSDNVPVPTSNSYASPVLVMSETITDFEGGGFLATFSAYSNGTAAADAFGTVFMVINGVEVDRQSYGVRTASGQTYSIIPVTVGGVYDGGSEVTIEVYAYNRSYNSDTNPHASYILTGVSLTISGAQR